jgi:hypothetical protein
METLQTRPAQVQPIVVRAMKAKRPIFLWGAPGIGKSELIENITYNVLPGKNLMIDMRLALMEPTDLRGYPFRNPDNNQMEWAPPADLPTQETAEEYDTIVLFLDELNSAPPSVQAAAYQLVLNGKIGQYVLPKNVRIVAAGNRDTDRGVTYRMPAPLANRFRHINMEVNFEDWSQWAVNNNVHPDVIGYLSYAKQDLFDFDPKSNSQAFASPRSWNFVSEILNVEEFEDASAKEQMAELAGAVGEGMAIKFAEHRKVAAYLPNPTEVLDGKVTKLDKKVSGEISAKYSLTVGLAYELNEVWKEVGEVDAKIGKMLNNMIRFAFDNFEPEMVIFALKTLMKDYQIVFNFRKVLDKDIQTTFNDKYLKYIV